MVASIILTNMLPTSGFAAYSYFQLTVSMLAAYASMGLGITAAKYFAEYSRHNLNTAPPLGTLWVISVAFGLMMAVGVLFVPKSLIGASLGIHSWLFAVGIFALCFSILPTAGIVGLEKFKAGTLSSAISSVVIVLGSLLAGALGSASMAMLFFVLSSLVHSVVNCWIIFRNIGIKRVVSSVDLRKDKVRDIFRFAAPMAVVTLLTSSATWIMGRILLSQGNGAYQFSLYAIGLQWLSLALFLPGMITRVIFPKFVKTRREDCEERGQTKVLMRSGILYASLSGLIVCLLVALFGPLLINLYGEQYTGQRWLLLLFVVASLPLAPTGSIGNAIIANEGQNAWLLITMVWFSFLMVIAWLLRDMGAVGMAVSYGICGLLMFSMAYLYARNRKLI